MHFLPLLPLVFFVSKASALVVSPRVAPRDQLQHLAARAPPETCSSSLITWIDGALSQYKDANRLCMTILGRSGASPITTVGNTVAQTGTTTGYVTASTVTVTVSSDTNTVQQTATSTATITSTVTSTDTTTLTVDTTETDSTFTDMPTVTSTATTYTSTIITYTYSPATPVKRGSSNLGDVYPGCPNSLKNIKLDIARTACECFLGSVQTATALTAQATTVGVLQTVTPTATVTVPAGTVTSISTIIETSSASTTTTVTDTVTTTQTAHTTASTTVQTTTTTTTAATQSQTAGIVYQFTNPQPGTFPGCSYGTYYNTYTLTNDPGPNNDYADAIDTCLGYCYAERTSEGCEAAFISLESGRLTCYLSRLSFNEGGQYLHCDQPTDFSAGFSIIPS
ncbi:hypothetical protein D9758_013752 [Tetrapyrgos nigripes]|uniref:Apple domain-containing protein n=1 Tax=Tetrapyrgos nigripes TaxID=182062 RepID=A0A8H5G1R4_9AGAR|nr:hypothetical protein D9758_013752 [Tetrapyrgos nigripes]